jgi:hypothetical protein
LCGHFRTKPDIYGHHRRAESIDPGISIGGAGDDFFGDASAFTSAMNLGSSIHRRTVRSFTSSSRPTAAADLPRSSNLAAVICRGGRGARWLSDSRSSLSSFILEFTRPGGPSSLSFRFGFVPSFCVFCPGISVVVRFDPRL